MDDQTLRAAIEAKWSCRVHDFAELEPVDAWAEKEGRLVAYLERKTRNVTLDTYPTAIIDARKWLGLLAAEHATGTQAVLAYGWACGSWGWVRPTEVGPRLEARILTPGPEAVSLGRHTRPVFDIPLDAFVIYGGAS